MKCISRYYTLQNSLIFSFLWFFRLGKFDDIKVCKTILHRQGWEIYLAYVSPHMVRSLLQLAVLYIVHISFSKTSNVGLSLENSYSFKTVVFNTQTCFYVTTLQLDFVSVLKYLTHVYKLLSQYNFCSV